MTLRRMKPNRCAAPKPSFCGKPSYANSGEIMEEVVKCPYCEDVPPWEECEECDGTGFIWEERLDGGSV